MRLLNAGAPRPATGDARLATANDLVRRTLAQHGLMPGGDGSSPAPTIRSAARNTADPMAQLKSRMPNMDFGDLTSRLSGMTRSGGAMANFGATADPVIPDGAAFETGSYSNAAGRRDYRLYVPAKADAVTGVVMMLHGCTQTPEDFAAGTGMNALAEARGFVVIYPRQSRGDNAQSCWNWFQRSDQTRDRGEPAILAGLAREVAARFGIGAERTFVAGLSAGAAMAVILGETHGDSFAAVGAHSGLAYGAARDVPSAFAAMGGTAADRRVLPRNGIARTIVFHGSADATVHPSNGETIGRDVLTTAGGQTIQTERRGTTKGRDWRVETTTDANGTTLLEHWTIDGLGHAWSGGQPTGSYTDAAGPDASAEMIRFFFDDKDI
ncbi:PHB depolymerase family esterase [Salipiger sp. IMCC34102]|uniref:extracellular catalytic domain type 1 short-chain-length polyhydroxyalkanoate depolymerase n=1 Tax=Salipiger sp. IMCC34102 TaxID=2510647 RepID=UPI00101DE0E1|nr:PHB depolymerase family esterase [Salipiger sp. IMCC34102]RYH03307.1 PHB depolymerase family esterase [Salipiger sp. IMCC34102]